MKRTNNNNFGWANNVCHGRVYLRIKVFKAYIHYRRPSLFIVLKNELQQHLNNASLSWRKFTAFNFCMVSTVTAKKVIHENKHKTRFHGYKRGTLQWAKTHHVQAGRHKQRMHILTKLNHLHAVNRHLCAPAHHVKE